MKSYRSLTIVAGFLLVISGCNDAAKIDAENKASEITLTTEKDKFSYGLGMIIGERVMKLCIAELAVPWTVGKGLRQ